MTTIQFAPKSGIIRQFIEEHETWIEERLGVGMSETIQLRFDYAMSVIAASKLLPGVRLSGYEKAVEQVFESRSTVSVRATPFFRKAAGHVEVWL